MNIAVIGDSNSFITTILFKAFIQVIKKINGIKLVAIIDATKYHPVRSTPVKNTIKYCIKRFFNPFDQNVFYYNESSFLDNYDGEATIIKTNWINDPLFISKIKNMNIVLTFSLACPQILQEETIVSFGKIVNYHDSLLPKYGGVNATAWSLLFGEKYTGYTYHYINNQIDEGNIIYQNKIKVNYRKSTYHNIIVKTYEASKKLGDVLRICCENYEGREQQLKEKSYFSKKDHDSILNVDSNMKISEIKQIIKCMGKVYMTYGTYGKVPVTKIEKKIKRIKYLPPLIYKISNKFLQKE